MKIHVFINCYWGTGMSGGDRRILELLRRWSECEQYSIVIYTTQKFHALIEKENIEHLPVVLVDQGENQKNNIILSYMIRTFQCIRRLKEQVKEGDIFYSTTDILPDIIPAAYLKFLHSTKYRWCMITFHIFEKFYKRPGNIIINFISCYQQKFANFLGKHKADTVMTTSPIVYDYFNKHKYNMKKVILVDNAVDIETIDTSNLELKGYDACFLARLNYSKGIFELPIIWKVVIKRYPDARLAIMGKGSDEIVEQLKEKIKEAGVQKHIDLLGYVSAEKAYSIMKKSKLFLFPSHEEGWGMALAEALVCGIPVVAYDLPVFRHLFKKGINLCKVKNIMEMAERVCYLLENEKERLKQGCEGRHYILEHYSLDIVAEKELEILLNQNT